VPLTGFIERLRRASRRSPRYLAQRAIDIGAVRLRRPWSNVYPHLITPARVAASAGAPSVDALWEAQQRVTFFFSPADREHWTRAFRTKYPDGVTAVIGAADGVLRHEFDLLGSGCVNLGPSLPWHTDFKTGREWPLQYSPDIDYAELDRPTDVKVPWELSRCQHFTVLGQAYWLTGDERYAREFVNEVQDWIARNPWGHGVNWACAMDVALRAVSWIWGFYFMSDSAACAAPAFRGAFLRALYLHGEHVATHIERSDVNGNHYLCDAVGLVFLGSFFRSTAKGRQWLETGREMIAAEMFNQTSVDGVDFEMSTPYHRLVLEALLTCGVLLARNGEPFSSAWQSRLERMLEFVEAYVKPDGGVPLVGDADDGRIQKLGTQGLNDHRYLLSSGAALLGRADFKRAAGHFGDESFWLLGPDGAAAFDAIAPAAPPLQSKAFTGGGFFALRSERAHVFVDCGEVGMHGRGGHGHNDILSFELWLDGMNLITDCGAYLYTASREWRNRFRSTAFHNVVQVDGEELNRFISPDNLWQLHDDARPQDVEWKPGSLVDYFRGSHTGYLRLTPPVAVTREIALVKDGPDVIVRDAIGGAGIHTLVWRFHLDPAVDAEIVGDDVRLSSHGREAWLQLVSTPTDMATTVEGGWSSSSYGVRTEIRVVVLRVRIAVPQAATFRFGLGRLPLDRLHDLAAVLPSHASALPVGI
jgi:hypothetical protein